MLTDNEIIKALECLKGYAVKCRECPYSPRFKFPHCQQKVAKDALDLINRQKAEIELMRGYIHRNNLEYDLLSYKRMVSIDDE